MLMVEVCCDILLKNKAVREESRLDEVRFMPGLRCLVAFAGFCFVAEGAWMEHSQPDTSTLNVWMICVLR